MLKRISLKQRIELSSLRNARLNLNLHLKVFINFHFVGVKIVFFTNQPGGDGNEKGEPGIALFDYSAANDTEMSFKEGDELTVLEKV